MQPPREAAFHPQGLRPQEPSVLSYRTWQSQLHNFPNERIRYQMAEKERKEFISNKIVGHDQHCWFPKLQLHPPPGKTYSKKADTLSSTIKKPAENASGESHSFQCWLEQLLNGSSRVGDAVWKSLVFFSHGLLFVFKSSHLTPHSCKEDRTDLKQELYR